MDEDAAKAPMSFCVHIAAIAGNRPVLYHTLVVLQYCARRGDHVGCIRWDCDFHFAWEQVTGNCHDDCQQVAQQHVRGLSSAHCN